MYRFSVPIVLVLLLAAGCRSTAPTTDPFFGRTTIPPPGTGSATGQRVDPYYQAPAPIQNPPLAVAQPTTTTIQPNASGGATWSNSAPRPLSTGTSSGLPAATNPSNTAPLYRSPNSAALPPAYTNPCNTAPLYRSPNNTNSPPANTYPNRATTPTPSPQDWTSSGSSSTSTNANRPSINVSLPPCSNMTTGRAGSLDDRTPRPVNNSAVNPSANAPITRTITPRPTANNNDRVIDLKDLPPAD